MTAEVLSVLTYKSVDTLIESGGTQSWTLDRRRAKACSYVVVCRNAYHPEVEGSERHHQAFMIATIKDIVPSTETKGRWLVLFESYVEGDFGDQWEGRNPVAYWDVNTFDGINFDKLRFLPMPKHETIPKPSLPGLSIEEAKKGLSVRFGVNADDIEITIRA